MKHWDLVQQAALDSHGIITFAQAKDLGIFPAEIYRWCKTGRIMKVARGVFRLMSYPSQGMISNMATLLASVGDGSYLYGESALAFLGLCPTRPYVATVAVPRRIRKHLDKGVSVVKAASGYRPYYHSGIACQHPRDAIRSSIGVLEAVRLGEAVDEAERLGYFTQKEADELRKDVNNGKTTS